MTLTFCSVTEVTGGLWADAGVVRYFSPTDHGLVIQITLLWKEAGIPGGVSCADRVWRWLGAGRQRCSPAGKLECAQRPANGSPPPSHQDDQAETIGAQKSVIMSKWHKLSP